MKINNNEFECLNNTYQKKAKAAVASTSKDDEKKNEDMIHIPGDEELKYDVGECCNVLFHNLMSKIITKDGKADSKTMLETMYEFDIVLEFFSIVVHICMADGKLGKSEEAFVRRAAQFWQMPDPQLDEALLGKDLSEEFVVNIQKYWTKLCPDLSDAQMVLRCNALKNDVITYGILAASQEGLFNQEYESAKKMAKKLGLKESCITDNVEIVKAEKELAQLIKKKFLRNKK